LSLISNLPHRSSVSSYIHLTIKINRQNRYFDTTREGMTTIPQ
jgi:hypothetical protein